MRFFCLYAGTSVTISFRLRFVFIGYFLLGITLFDIDGKNVKHTSLSKSLMWPKSLSGQTHNAFEQ